MFIYFILEGQICKVSDSYIMTFWNAVEIQQLDPRQSPHTPVSQGCGHNFSTEPDDSHRWKVASNVTVFTSQNCL